MLLMQMKNILILTDFSYNSWNSIDYALNLFKDKTIHFFILKSLSSKNEYLNLENKVNSDKELDLLLNKIKNAELNKKHTFNVIKDNRNIVIATKEQLKANDIDLIIVGTNDLTLKNVKNNHQISEELITRVHCDILVVPNTAKFIRYNEIVFATEFTNFLEAKLTYNLRYYTPFKKSKFRFLYLSKTEKELNKDQQWNKETLHDYFKNVPHSFNEKTNTNLAISLDEFVDETNADLIITAAKNLNLIEQLIYRPNSKNLSYPNKTPFLVLNQNSI
jgi:hypothetical protein